MESNFTGETLTLPNNLKISHFTHNKNGLRVLISEIHDAPICGYMRVVNAGSAMENGLVGKGIAHFIEHMSFRIDGGKYWQFERQGHEDNAMTTEDATSFYDFGNSKHIEKLIQVDGHRFLTAEVPAAGIPIEMMAVLNEKKRGEEACGTLFRTAQSCSHLYSNYHCPTIGLEEDIESVSAKDMKTFRETYYNISNATFVVVGHVNTDKVLQAFEKQYGNVAAVDFTPKKRPQEPLQLGKRIIEINMPSPCAMMCLTWHSPPAASKDSIALNVLSKIISNGNAGRKVEVLRKNIIHNLGCYSPRNLDEYIWCLHGAFDQVDKIDKGEKLLTDMLVGIYNNVSKKEVETAIKSLKKEWSVEPFKNIRSTTMALGEACAIGNWKDITQRYETLKTINKYDIRQIIEKYLTNSKLTVVKLLPSSEHVKPSIKKLNEVKTENYKPNKNEKKCTWSASARIAQKGNMKIQHLETSGNTTILSITIPIDFEKRWEASLFSNLFGKQCHYNNKNMSTNDIATLCTDLDIEFNCYYNDNTSLNFKFEFNDSNKVEKAMDFVIEGLLKKTKFDSTCFNTTLTSMIAEINSLKQQDKYQSKEMLMTKMFKNTSYNESIRYKVSKMGNLSENKIKFFYVGNVQKPKQWYCTITTPKNMLERHFKNMLDKIKYTALFASKYNGILPSKTKWEKIEKPKTIFEQKILPGYGSTTVMMGQSTNIENYSKKCVALSLAVQALGGGMTSRLMWKLRGKDGKKNGVYGVYAMQQDGQKSPSFVIIDATFTPSCAVHGIRELKDMIREWTENGITEKELDIAKRQMKGNRELEMDDFSSVSSVFHMHLSNDKDGQKEWNNYLETLDNISMDDVKEAMKELKPDRWSTVCTTPFKLDNSFDDSDSE